VQRELYQLRRDACGDVGSRWTKVSGAEQPRIGWPDGTRRAHRPAHPEGLRLVDELGAIDSADEVARTVSRLRAQGLSPDLVSAAVGQARLRTRARAKFGAFADRMLFTRAGLEQATRLSVGAPRGRFRDAGVRRVADLGCGIGGDALAFAGIGLDVLAVDADETTAALAAYNLARSATPRRCAMPAPRTSPRRRRRGVARSGPTHGRPHRDRAGRRRRLVAVAGMGLRSRGAMPAGIKLGPAFDRARIPETAEAQWISVDGSTIELVVWTGKLARAGVRRSALVVRSDRAAELTASSDAEDAEVRPRALSSTSRRAPSSAHA
jgi:SAM-dependent methyltransferase